MVAAVLAVAALHAWLPASFRVAPGWVFQLVLLGFILVLVVGDPGRIDRQATWLRVTMDLMIALITAVNVAAIGHLVQGILDNAAFADAPLLLRIGAVVWTTNVLAFALWYWDLDRGGPAARAAGGTRTPAFVFPEMSYPEHVAPGWYPTFVDYLTLSFGTATAFSPTDVSAIKPWAKLLMTVEAAASLVVALLVFARAVNTIT
jgi:hypothetical protein